MVQSAHTHHACSFCRRKRAKCDGKRPCDRCRRWNQDCMYDQRTQESKSDIRKERDELRIQNQDANTVIRALQNEETGPETMASLQRRAPIDQLASRLRQSSPKPNHHSFISQNLSTDESALSAQGDLDDAHEHSSEDLSSHSPSRRRPTTNISSERDGALISLQGGNFFESEPLGFEACVGYMKWGIVGLDIHQIHDLLNVFFDWQYIPLLFVDKGLFVQDFTSGKDTYCSPALIRVILCLACRSLSGYDKISSFHVNLGGRLLHEAKEILHEKKNCRDGLPNAQALSLLAVHELGSHDMREALDLVEECVCMLTSLRLKEAPVDQIAILSWTSAVSTCLHGAISLARIIRLYFECLHSPPSYLHWHCDAARSPKESVLELLRTPSAIEPSDASDNVTSLLVSTTSLVYCFLSTVAEPSPDYLNELLNIYQTCLSAYTKLIPALQTLEACRTSLTFTHLVYHFSLMSLCRPFYHVATLDPPINFRAISLEAAQAILQLSTICQGLVPSHRLPCFVPLFVHAAGFVSIDLAVNIADMPRTAILRSEESSIEDKHTDASTSASLTTSSSGLTSPPVTPAFVIAREKGMRKFENISASPFPTVRPTIATPGVKEALNSLEAMSSLFPVSRGAKDHLQGLLDATDTQQNYRFPLAASGEGKGG